tara:strand:- start:477 stop:995 length:519 start_codon:yes stop_codon:yes gene_type:complete
MNARSLFKKKQSYRKIIVILSCLIILFFFLYFFILSNENKFIVIPANTDVFYIVPEDKGGEKVANLDKKSLNKTTKEIVEHEIEKPEDLLFSIQFFTDSQMINVNQYLQKITNSDESIYSIDDFYILALTSEIGIEYFLLYKNFITRLDATNYCIKFLPKMNNCLVVDTTKF